MTNTMEAKLHLVNRMNNSTETIEYKIIDITHKTFKESSVVSSIGSAISVGANLIKGFKW